MIKIGSNPILDSNLITQTTFSSDKSNSVEIKKFALCMDNLNVDSRSEKSIDIQNDSNVAIKYEWRRKEGSNVNVQSNKGVLETGTESFNFIAAATKHDQINYISSLWEFYLVQIPLWDENSSQTINRDVLICQILATANVSKIRCQLIPCTIISSNAIFINTKECFEFSLENKSKTTSIFHCKSTLKLLRTPTNDNECEIEYALQEMSIDNHKLRLYLERAATCR